MMRSRRDARSRQGRRSGSPARLALALGCWLAWLFWSAAPALAQASDPELRPTRGPLITGAVRSGDADATAVELNPGALGLLPAGGLDLVGAAADEGATIPRRGAGLYWATPFFGHSVLGLALTHVTGGDGAGIDTHTAFRLAYALRFLRGASLGVAWAHLWQGAFAGTDTFDFGLSVRGGRYLALGVTVEDVGAPHPAALSVALPRLWTGELAVRPLGTDRLELAVGAAHADGDAWRRLVPRARLAVRLTDGLRLYGDAQTSPRGGQLAFAGGSDTRASVGLAFDFDHLGAAVGLHAYFPGAGDGGAGVAGRIHFDGERRPALAAPAYVARVSLDGLHDDRAFAALVRRLRALAVDPAVAGVLLKLENVELGFGRVEELRDLIALLRAHGKKTFAYATFPSTRGYYLAAACDLIVLHPAGELALTGIAQEVTFYKGAMDRLGVRLELIRVGAFKGAMEPFILTEQSPAVRANKNQLLDDVFTRVTTAVAADRSRAGHRMAAADVRALVERGIFTPAEAAQAGLSDATVAENDLEPYLAQALGRTRIALRDPDRAPVHPLAWSSRRVAVLLVDGTIVDGPSENFPFGLETFAGADTLVEALKHCEQTPTIGAVVLRVNSPGGSAFASDVVAREIKRLRAAGKPVVVSMGDLAASGGYYIAAPADVIYAEPSTLSGSIGIFGYKVDAKKLLDTVGVSVETYRRGAHADFLSPFRPWTAEEVKIAEDKIRHLYGLFLDTVAEGRRSRGLTRERVDEIGQGHIWTGALAQGLGLVDRMGGLSAAVDEAARLAGVPLGRDQMPEIEMLPHDKGGLLRKLVGAATEAGEGAGVVGGAGAVEADDREAAAGSGALDDDSQTGAVEGAAAGGAGAAVAQLMPPEVRAALHLLAPFLMTGSGVGFEARLPYEIDLR
jgi:protease-4